MTFDQVPKRRNFQAKPSAPQYEEHREDVAYEILALRPRPSVGAEPGRKRGVRNDDFAMPVAGRDANQTEGAGWVI